MACGATLKRSLEFDPLHSPTQRPPKRRRCMPGLQTQFNSKPSPFGFVSSKLDHERIAADISNEVKRLQRRRQLDTALSYYRSQRSPSSSPEPHVTVPNINSPSCPSGAELSSVSTTKREIPLFTFRQVSLVCERLLKQREEEIREEYNNVLNLKLAEQYEAFLKFNHDQIQQKFGERPASYVS